jgi:hypothetical protein
MNFHLGSIVSLETRWMCDKQAIRTLVSDVAGVAMECGRRRLKSVDT